MIRAVRCNQGSFRTVEFAQGFNVVLADRTKESTKRGSRNGLGKTTLIEIIHFCLGASAAKGTALHSNDLQGWTFSLDIDLRGKPYTISRNVGKPNRVLIRGDWSDWPMRPEMVLLGEEASMSIQDWNSTLGHLTFDLPLPVEGQRYAPTFRSLISYFVRRGHDAFSSPFEHFRKQSEWDKQVNNAFLLDLGWEYAQRSQVLRDQERVLSQLKEAAQSGFMPDLIGSIGELETTKVRLEEQCTQQEEQLRSFKVHPQYEAIEDRANALTMDIHELCSQNVLDRRMVDFYESSLVQETPGTFDRVAQMYGQAGIALPEQVVKRLGDVQLFHERIVTNRRGFLQAEIARLEALITKRNAQVQSHSDERAELLSVLASHGALAEYSKLQEIHVQAVSELGRVVARIDNLRKFEQGRSTLHIEKEALQLQARADYEDREVVRKKAISMFNANSEALYEAPGNLIINVGPNGFRFDVQIERSGSTGIDKMKVFCYDLMLAQLWTEHTASPSLLIHDSIIFDGVDERQIAQALELAEQRSNEFGFQYICCLNSDLIPWHELDEGFDLRSFVCHELTDTRPDGSLLGIKVRPDTGDKKKRAA